MGILVAVALVAGTVVFVPAERLEKLRVWTNIAADDVESRIDALIGKEKVLREQALTAIQDAEADIQRLQEVVIASRVDADLLEEKLASLRELETKSKQQLGRLAQLVEADESITVDGVVWQPADLTAYAETKITAHTAITERIRVYEESLRIQKETAERGDAALRVARQNVANMYASLELLDAKLALLAALQAQPTAFTGGNVSVDSVLNDTESLIQSLLDEVEREVRMAEERNDVQYQAAANDDTPLPEVAADDLAERLYMLAGQE